MLKTIMLPDFMYNGLIPFHVLTGLTMGFNMGFTGFAIAVLQTVYIGWILGQRYGRIK